MFGHRLRLRPSVALAALILIPLSLTIAARTSAWPASGSAEALEPNAITRIAGSDRYGTSVAASRATWGAGEARTVVLARGDVFADALAGAPLAAQRLGPLLINPPGSLRSDVVAEIRRVLPPSSIVYVIGGTSGIPQSVVSSLSEYRVERIAGADRYKTSVLIAKRIDVQGLRDRVFVATGRNFPDAIAASQPASAGTRGGHRPYPILLTNDEQMPPVVETYIRGLVSLPRPGNFQIYAAGGQAAAAAETTFGTTANISIDAFAGANRYATSALIAASFDPFDQAESIGLASGEAFPDALSAAGLLARQPFARLLLTRATTLPTSIHDALRPMALYGPVHVLGGAGRVSDAVATAAASLLPPDIFKVTATDGSTTALTLSSGEAGDLAFSADKGQRILIKIADANFTGCLPVRMWQPNWTTLAPDTPGSLCMSLGRSHLWDSLPAAGTYHLVLDPQLDDAGTVAVTVSTVTDLPDQPIALDGEVVALVFNPGQNGGLTFDRPANGKALLILSESEGMCTTLKVYAPNGGVVYERPCNYGVEDFINGKHVLDFLPLPGTYRIFFDPWGLSAGKINAQLESL